MHPSNHSRPRWARWLSAIVPWWARWSSLRMARWVPIRPLSPRHMPRILAHLLGLSAHDRYLRFGYLATDERQGQTVLIDEFFPAGSRRLGSAQEGARRHAALHQALKAAGVAWRDTASFGLPGAWRVSVQPPSAQDAMLAVLRQWRGDGWPPAGALAVTETGSTR